MDRPRRPDAGAGGVCPGARGARPPWSAPGRHPSSALRLARDLLVSHHHRLPRRSALVRSGPATGLRLQPPRGAAGVPGGRTARSPLRDVLLGYRDHRGVELQPSHRRRAREARAGRGGGRAPARRRRPAGRARPDRRHRSPSLRGSGRQAGDAGPRLRRRHARGGAAVPRRSRGRDVLRRRHDEPAAVEPVDARRHAAARHRRDRADAGTRAGEGAESSGRPASLHPRRRGQPAARPRRGRRRPPRSD